MQRKPRAEFPSSESLLPCLLSSQLGSQTVILDSILAGKLVWGPREV